MKRPLALFGCIYFVILLAATRFPLAVIFPLSIVFLLLGIVATVFWKKQKISARLTVILSSALFACIMILGYQKWQVQPLQVLDGNQYTVTARVVEASPSNGGDTSDVTLQVLEGIPTNKKVKVEIVAFPESEVGELVKTELVFYQPNARTSQYSYSQGMFIGARYTGDVKKIGTSLNFLARMRLLQYRASENISKFLPERLSSVATAMALGDNRFLSNEAKDAYRAAGLTHILVVSGMHLSVLCGLAYEIILRVTRHKKIASIFCMGFTILFMCFTGFSPSVMRSGISYLILYTGILFTRKADTYTSLGLAVLLLCLQNPYAANDVGLQLSFAATLGAVLAAKADRKLQYHWREKPAGKFKKIAQWFIRLCVSPIIVSVATLPVLLASRLGVSALSLPMNIIALPFSTPVVLISILLGVFGGISWLAWLLKPLAFVAGVALVILEKITTWCTQFDAFYLYIGGALALAIILLYPIGYFAYKTKRWKSFVAVGLVVLFTGATLNITLTKNTVRVTVAGSGTNPSVVVTSGKQAVVIYRDRRTAWSIQQIMREQGATDCVLFIDLRKTSQTTEYISLFEPKEIVRVGEDVVSQAVYSPLLDTEISVQKQGDGMVACVDIAGYKVALNSGSVTMKNYPSVDIFVAGSGTAENVEGTVLVNGAWPKWLNDDNGQTVLVNTGKTVIWVRPQKSVRIQEAQKYGQSG